MYKVFINDKEIFLKKNINKISERDKNFSYRHISKNSLLSEIKQFIHGNKKQILIYSKDFKKLEKDFFSLFKLIDAAGGLVKNNGNKFLFIFRRGKWDLPKGKTEKNESLPETAVREVKEECGISNLKITRALPDTYHIYFLENDMILKQTHWFEMACPEYTKLIPQTEEDITCIRWFDRKEIKKEVLPNTHKSINSLLEYYFSKIL